MEFIIRPEPDPEEQNAVALALERLFAADELPLAYRSRWRAEGVAENLDSEGSNGVTALTMLATQEADNVTGQI